MISVNNKIVCAPFKKAHNEPIKKGFVVTNKVGLGLEGLKVLVDAEVWQGDCFHKITVGSTIYVRSDAYKAPWAEKGVSDMVVDEKGEKTEFILVPFSEVILVDEAGD